MSGDDTLSDIEQAVVDDAIAFAGKHLEPMAETWESESKWPRAWDRMIESSFEASKD